MKKVKIEVTEEQARLIQKALDFYSRVGAGQFSVIAEHPTFEKHLHKEFATGSGKFEVGDETVRGEVVEVDPKYKWIKTKGSWGNGEEIKKWKDLDKIYYSTNYSKYHIAIDTAKEYLYSARNVLYNDWSLSSNGHWGIFNENVDESCRVAYDIIQRLRHEFWKINPKRSDITVDAYVHTSAKDADKIKIEIDEYNTRKRRK